MKDIVDGIWERIKSPFFGYLAFSFIALNWEELFLLFFSNQDALQKVVTFNLSTTTWGLLILPSMVGGFLTALSPWINLGFFKVTKLANEMMNSEHASLQSALLIKQAQLEDARNILQSQREKEALEKAKIDDEISQISDEETRKKAEESIRSIRNRDAHNTSTSKSSYDPDPMETAEIDEYLREILIHNKFVLYYNPQASLKKHKIMRFGDNGNILEGNNVNEAKWDIHKSVLTFSDSSNEIHNNFLYDFSRQAFISTGETEVGAWIKHGIARQYLVYETNHKDKIRSLYSPQ